MFLNHKLILEKPNRLPERNLLQTHQLKVENRASCRRERCSEQQANTGEVKPAVGEKVAQKPPAKTGEAKPTFGEKSASKPPAKSEGTRPAVGEKIAKLQQLKV